jgi:hypothetical protein
MIEQLAEHRIRKMCLQRVVSFLLPAESISLAALASSLNRVRHHQNRQQLAVARIASTRPYAVPWCRSTRPAHAPSGQRTPRHPSHRTTRAQRQRKSPGQTGPGFCPASWRGSFVAIGCLASGLTPEGLAALLFFSIFKFVGAKFDHLAPSIPQQRERVGSIKPKIKHERVKLQSDSRHALDIVEGDAD